MARISRGFTVSNPRPAVHPSCPTTGNTQIDPSDPGDWVISVDWAGTQLVGICSCYLTVNGGPTQLVAVQPDVTSSTQFDFGPTDYASSGDIISVWVVCTHVAGCPDFSTIPAQESCP